MLSYKRSTNLNSDVIPSLGTSVICNFNCCLETASPRSGLKLAYENNFFVNYVDPLNIYGSQPSRIRQGTSTSILNIYGSQPSRIRQGTNTAAKFLFL